MLFICFPSSASHLACFQFREAVEFYNDVIGNNPEDMTAWTLLGCLHLEKEEWGVAQKKFERILEKIDRNDVYSLLALGNVYFAGQFDKKYEMAKNM